MKTLIACFLFATIHCSAIFVGNPSSPTIYSNHLVFENTKNIGLRMDYVADYIFHSSFKEEFTDLSNAMSIKMNTFSGMAILNLFHRMDIYGLLGGSKLEIRNEFFAPRRKAWGLGTKVSLFKYYNFCFSLDAKYFYSRQKPAYFLVEGLPSSLLSDFSVEYSEYQGAFGVSYELMNFFYPYLALTYTETRVSPRNSSGLIEISAMDLIQEFDATSSVNRHKWGLGVGFSFLSDKTITLNVESRFFDQNGINISGEISF